MAWKPVSNTVPQYHVSGSPASGYYLKFYKSGTTTAISMATDSTGGTTLAKCAINSEGYPINGSSAVFIPHINQPYKVVLYTNSTDADADTTGNAAWIVDALSHETANTSVYELGSTAAATSHPSVTGYTITTNYHDSDRVAGSGGTFRFTGTTTAGKAGDWPNADGYFYDADGKQFAVTAANTYVYGGAPTAAATSNRTALQSAISANTIVTVSPGTYAHLSIASAVILRMEGKPTFKLSDSTVTTPSTQVPVLGLDADNIIIYGEFVVDGNYSNQSISEGGGADQFDSETHGALQISGSNVRVYGTAYINNAYWVGAEIGASQTDANTSGSELTGVYIQELNIDTPRYYGCVVWSVDGWKIDRIKIANGGGAGDNRLRLGTGASPTSECKNGYLGFADCDAVVLEDGTNNVHIDAIHCESCKLEKCVKVTINSVYANAHAGGGAGFFLNDAVKCAIGRVVVTEYAGSFVPVAVSGDTSCQDCVIDSVLVDGTAVSVEDVRIRTFERLHIGSMVLTNPHTTPGRGLLVDYDAAYAPQDHLSIDSIYSAGHSPDDVFIETGITNVHVGKINNDAVVNTITTSGSSIPNTNKFLHLEVFDAATATATGNGKKYFIVPDELDRWNLRDIKAVVASGGTGAGTLSVQVHNVSTSQDMLSTVLSVDAGEPTSETAATPAVINTTYDLVEKGQYLRIDVDSVHGTTPANGLFLTLSFGIND